MFVNTEQIKIGVNNFIDNEIGKKSSGFQKFVVYFALPIINKKVESFVNAFAENELTKDMFDENKNIDLDKIYNMSKDAIHKSGQFLLYGIVFNETDIDKLYASIRSTGGNL